MAEEAPSTTRRASGSRSSQRARASRSWSARPTPCRGRFQLDVSGEGLDLGGIAGNESATMAVSLRGSFTAWGEPVAVTPPGAYAPLEELYRQFLGF